jgi:glycosyltransferase involved in cell wall biosynthesis
VTDDPGDRPGPGSERARPTVSIGMPVYNGAAFLAAALDGLANQTHQDVEIVISDNASEDETEAIARAHAARDSRIRYERSPVNRGLVWNFRRVLELARGEYFMYAPYDDLFAPDYLERCLAALRRDPGATYAVAISVLIDADGRRIGIERLRQRVADPSPSVRFWDTLMVQGGLNFYGLARTATWRRVGPYPMLPRGERVITAALALRGRFAVLPAELYHRRVHDAQVTAVRRDRRAELRVVDPGRAGWRASTPVVLAEYALAYVIVALRAPIGWVERARVLGCIGRWGLGHVPGLAVRDERTRAVVIDDPGSGRRPVGREGIGF